MKCGFYIQGMPRCKEKATHAHPSVAAMGQAWYCKKHAAIKALEGVPMVEVKEQYREWRNAK